MRTTEEKKFLTMSKSIAVLLEVKMNYQDTKKWTKKDTKPKGRYINTTKIGRNKTSKTQKKKTKMMANKAYIRLPTTG